MKMKEVKYIIADSEEMLNKELLEFIKENTKNGEVIALRILEHKQNSAVRDMAFDKADTYRRADGQWLYNGMFVKAEIVQNAFLSYSRKVELYQVENTNAPIFWIKQEV